MGRPGRTGIFNPQGRRLLAGLVALTLSAGVGLAHAPGAWAAGALDQSQTTVSSGTSDYISIPGPSHPDRVTAAQTFTAGKTGLLDQVDLHLGTVGDAFDDLVVEIRTVDGNSGEPEGTVLATSTFSSPDGTLAPDWRSVPFSSPATVSETTRYAIVVYGAEGSSDYRWSVSGPSTDPYASGEPFTIEAGTTFWASLTGLGDAAFRTYVSPGGADVSVSFNPPATVKTRSTFTYTITVANAGPETAEEVVLTVPLPYGANYVGITSSAGTCTQPGRGVQTITCDLGDITSGNGSTHEVSLKVTGRAGRGHLNHAVTVTSATDDPDMADNTATASTAITR